MLYTDIRAVNPSQKLTFFYTGTFTLLILEQGQLGALTLYPKWLCLVDKLNPKLYTVPCTLHTELCMYLIHHGTWLNFNCIYRNISTPEALYLCPTNKLVHPSYISPLWPNHVLYSICGSVCVCMCGVEGRGRGVRCSFTLSKHSVTVRTT